MLDCDFVLFFTLVSYQQSPIFFKFSCFETFSCCRPKMSQNKFVFIETEYGSVRGTRKSTVLGMSFINFQGIPYMKAPVGKLRFRDAQPPEKWTEPLDASAELSFPNIDFITGQPVGQENAGIVNIYTKDASPEKKWPVFVWVKNVFICRVIAKH